jgi:hypothetical protein
MRHRPLAALGLLLAAVPAWAGVGDPQVRTDHPWYPGELACSTFERLAATEAEVYERVTGTKPTTDEQKALAAWLWRNTHYAHANDKPWGVYDAGCRNGLVLRGKVDCAVSLSTDQGKTWQDCGKTWQDCPGRR